MAEPTPGGQPPPPLEPVARKRSVPKRFFLFSAGGTPEVLDECPHSEERLIAGLGSLVMVTTLLALVSMFVLSLVGLQRPIWVALPIAVGWSCAIYAIDRFLVSVPLNPHKFSLNRISENAVTIESPWWRRLGVSLRTVGGVVPRLFLALTAGILIAEPLLLVAFHDEVKERVTEAGYELSDRLAAHARAYFDPQIEAQSKPQTPAAQDLYNDRQRLANGLSQDLSRAQADLDTLDHASKEEFEGNVVTFTDPIDGKVKQTTGHHGYASEAAELSLHLTQAQDRVVALEKEQQGLQSRVSELTAGQAATDEATRETLLGKLQEQKAEALKAADNEGTGSGGLLMQVQALEALARDPNPFSSATPAASGPSTRPLGGVDTGPTSTKLLGLTTLGIVVWLTRIFIILLDTMAIFGKLFLSLRRRRPYDAVTAEHEERAVINATKQHLENLNDLNRSRDEISAEAALRRGRLRQRQVRERSTAMDERPHLRVSTEEDTKTYSASDDQPIVIHGAPQQNGHVAGNGVKVNSGSGRTR